MKQVFLLISLIFAHQAFAVCSSPIARTNFSANQVLTSTRLNADLNAAYTRANELPGDCITSESVTTTQIDDGTITNADISASAAIDLTKTKYAVAILSDVKASGVSTQTTVSTTWNIREINTEVDTDGIVTLASNQFTLGAGTYIIETCGVAHSVSNGIHRLKLYNVTDAVDLNMGTTGYSVVDGGSPSVLSGQVTISGSKAFEVRHYTQNGYFGSAVGTPASLAGVSEVYLIVKITRIK